MNNETFLPIVKAIAAKFLGYKNRKPAPTGGTINSRYCYTVWLRHLIYASAAGFDPLNSTVAELGPGDSLGTGLAALLSGCRRYYALDIFKYWDNERNVKIFDQLVELFKQRTEIPGDTEFPRTTPRLSNYAFPSHILDEKLLKESLSEERINAIRNKLTHPNHRKGNEFINCYVPWNDETIIERDSVDLLFSQSALQYVNDLEYIYETIRSWLKVGGIMSHSIDFSSIHLTKTWNGHWTFSEREWKLIRKKLAVPVNRLSIIEHFRLMEKSQFEVTKTIKFPGDPGFTPKDFAIPFKDLSLEAYTTRAAFIQAIKQ